MDPVSTIRNLGPAMDAACAQAGIHTADTVRALGPDETYLRLLRSGMRAHFIGYYVLVMGLQGRPWNDCKGDEKKALRQRFDAIKAQAAGASDPDSALERALNEIGVLRRPTAQKAQPR